MITVVVVIAVMVVIVVAAEIGITEVTVAVVRNRTRAHQRKRENGDKAESFRQAHLKFPPVGPERQKDGIGGTVAPDPRRLFQSRTTAGRKKCDAELNDVERAAKRANAAMIACGFCSRCDNYFSLFLQVSSGFHFESAKAQILSMRGRLATSVPTGSDHRLLVPLLTAEAVAIDREAHLEERTAFSWLVYRQTRKQL